MEDKELEKIRFKILSECYGDYDVDLQKLDKVITKLQFHHTIKVLGAMKEELLDLEYADDCNETDASHRHYREEDIKKILSHLIQKEKGK